MKGGERALRRIEIEGFRSLRAVSLCPGRATVLIGPNGAGKSNVLAALRMVAHLRTQSLRRWVGKAGGASKVLHYGPKASPQMRLRLEFVQDDTISSYVATLGHAAGDSLVFLDEQVGYYDPTTGALDERSIGSGHTESLLGDDTATFDPTQKTVRRWLSQLSFFHFHDTSAASALRQHASRAGDTYLRADGSNLAAFLYRLAQSEGAEEVRAWRQIGMLLRRIAPAVKRLCPTLVDEDHPTTSAVKLEWRDVRDHVFGVDDLSDGTLRALALIVALSQPADRLPRFVTIDEPELGLHPAAISLLAELVRSVAPRCQVLLATQSPALLDAFAPGEVIVVEHEDGVSQLRQLDADALSQWLEDYALSALYEKNVLGGRP